MIKNEERIFILHLKNGESKIVKESEAIENALQQERDGIVPHYAWYLNGETESQAGFLVWSTYDGECGVVCRRSDGKMIILTGCQGDFAYI